MVSNLNDSVGRAVEWAKEHPKQSIAAMIISAGIVRKSRMKRNNNIGRLSSTISSGSQSAPSGSAAGMNAESSAWIQPNGAGYDNPMNQAERYGIRMSPYDQAQLPDIDRPGVASNYSSVADYRNDAGNDVNQDQTFSKMI